MEPPGIRVRSSNRHGPHSTTTIDAMPSYRAILSIGDVHPGHGPEAVMDSAVAAVSWMPWNVDDDGAPVAAGQTIDGQAVLPIETAIAGLYNIQPGYRGF